jgi:hypothetical protein
LAFFFLVQDDVKRNASQEEKKNGERRGQGKSGDRPTDLGRETQT